MRICTRDLAVELPREALGAQFSQQCGFIEIEIAPNANPAFGVWILQGKCHQLAHKSGQGREKWDPLTFTLSLGLEGPARSPTSILKVQP